MLKGLGLLLEIVTVYIYIYIEWEFILIIHQFPFPHPRKKNTRKKINICMKRMLEIQQTNLSLYSETSLKRTLAGQKRLSALEKCPLWRGLV